MERRCRRHILRRSDAVSIQEEVGLNSLKKNPIGVMQGRLLPKYEGRYQAHPAGYWQDEFPIAASLGLECIEFILDFDGAEANPLLAPGGTAEILECALRTGVSVRTICADYFMAAPIHDSDAAVAEQSDRVFDRLLATAEALGATDIVLPCVDSSTIRPEEARERFVERMLRKLPAIDGGGVNVSLETDLDPAAFEELLSRLPSERVTVNYDTGNSASLGFDPAVELAAYGRRISDIHIKDRRLGGGPVVLGTGAVDFSGFFSALACVNYSGPFILQAYRDDEGVAIFKEQLAWFHSHYVAGTWI